MNQVTLIGNLCRDIDLRQTVSGDYVGSSTLAVRRDRKNEKGEYDTDFFDVKFFKQQAEFASKYLRKGDKVCVSGRVQIRDYVTKEGIKGRAVEVLVNSVENLEPKQEVAAEDLQPAEEPEKKEEQPVVQNGEEVELSDDELPF